METKKQMYEAPCCVEVIIEGTCICAVSNEFGSSLEDWEEDNILGN